VSRKKNSLFHARLHFFNLIKFMNRKYIHQKGKCDLVTFPSLIFFFHFKNISSNIMLLVFGTIFLKALIYFDFFSSWSLLIITFKVKVCLPKKVFATYFCYLKFVKKVKAKQNRPIFLKLFIKNILLFL